jgi:uncharacterized cupin superfamily protein
MLESVRATFITDDLGDAMTKNPRLTLAAMLAASAGLFIALPASAQDSPSPVRMNPDQMAGLDLTPIPNDGFIDILVEGELEFEIARMFDGEELQVVVVESTPAKTSHRDKPLDYDEFVLVLNGKLVLTEPNGTVHEFTPGQAFVVPKGYRGTWEQHGRYRELAIIAQSRDEE